MDLDATMLSEVNQIQRDKYHLFLSYMNPGRGGQENIWKGGQPIDFLLSLDLSDLYLNFWILSFYYTEKYLDICYGPHILSRHQSP